MKVSNVNGHMTCMQQTQFLKKLKKKCDLSFDNADHDSIHLLLVWPSQNLGVRKVKNG